jgi:hypothetical protein
MNLAVGIATAALAALSAPASGQELPCMVCRAALPFGNCNDAAVANPPPGGISLTGRVVRVESIRCGAQLTVDVARTSAPALPSRIRINALPCLFWGGKTGETINAMVMDTPSESDTYHARTCY